MSLFASKTPNVILPTVENDPKQSHDSETTKKSSSSQDPVISQGQPTTTTTKPTASRTPSTRFEEQLHPSAPRTFKPNGIPQASRPAIPKPTASTTSKQNGQSTAPVRPQLTRRRTTARTRYIDMLLEIDSVPKFHNILASAFTWILLAGYLVFPATFTKLQKELNGDPNNPYKAKALATARYVFLFSLFLSTSSICL